MTDPGPLAQPLRGLVVLWRDEHLAAVDKPPGLFTHPSPQNPGEASCMTLLRDALGCWVYPVHRLDRATSGVLLFALSSAVARQVAAAFVRHEIAKTYEAIVRGHPPDAGRIDKALSETLGPVAKAPQAAVTDYRVLARCEQPWPVRPYASARYARVELRPQTGRSHQLRKHMAGISHPIIGDTTYGDGAHNREMAERLGDRRLLLHARELVLLHPVSGERLRLVAPTTALGAALTLFAAEASS